MRTFYAYGCCANALCNSIHTFSFNDVFACFLAGCYRLDSFALGLLKGVEK